MKYVPVAFSQNCLRGNKFAVQDSEGTELAVTMSWTRKCFLSGWGWFFKENLVTKVSVFHAQV